MAREYEESDKIKSIATDLIKLYHGHLETASIAYVMKLAPEEGKGEKSTRSGKHPKVGQAKSAPALWNAISGYDFVLEVDEVFWDRLTIEQQQALIDHELCHFGRDVKGWYIKDHDLEEFRAVIERHGMWHPGVEAFVLSHKQEDLPFESSSANAAP